MSEMTTIARPYAKASFEFAIEHNARNEWVKMLAYSAEVSKDELLRNVMDGAMNSDAVADLFISVCGKQLDEHAQNLVRVMARKNRLVSLPEVFEQFIDLCAKADNEITVEVISACDLTKQQEAEIIAKLEKRLARKVKLNCNIDETLIAGIIIRAGDLVIDNSVRNQLNRLSDAIKS